MRTRSSFRITPYRALLMRQLRRMSRLPTALISIISRIYYAVMPCLIPHAFLLFFYPCLLRSDGSWHCIDLHVGINKLK